MIRFPTDSWLKWLFILRKQVYFLKEKTVWFSYHYFNNLCNDTSLGPCNVTQLFEISKLIISGKTQDMAPSPVSHQRPGHHWDDEHRANGDEASVWCDVWHIHRGAHQPHEARHNQDHGERLGDQQQHGELLQRGVWESLQGGKKNETFYEVVVKLQKFNSIQSFGSWGDIMAPLRPFPANFMHGFASVLILQLSLGWSSSWKRWLRDRLCWNAQSRWTQSCDQARC